MAKDIDFSNWIMIGVNYHGPSFIFKNIIKNPPKTWQDFYKDYDSKSAKNQINYS